MNTDVAHELIQIARREGQDPDLADQLLALAQKLIEPPKLPEWTWPPDHIGGHVEMWDRLTDEGLDPTPAEATTWHIPGGWEPAELPGYYRTEMILGDIDSLNHGFERATTKIHNLGMTVQVWGDPRYDAHNRTFSARVTASHPV